MITDSQGCQSDRTDLVIYNPNLLPPFLYETNGREGVFPVEASFYAIEVKSRVTADKMKDGSSLARRQTPVPQAPIRSILRIWQALGMQLVPDAACSLRL